MAIRSGATAALALLLAATASEVGAQQVESGRRVDVREATVHVWNAVGRVTLRRGSGRELGITATARGGDARQLAFHLDRNGDSAVFRVQFPDVDEIARPGAEWAQGQSTDLNLREDGTFGGSDSRSWSRRSRASRVEVGRSRGGFDGWAEIEITVPEGRTVKVHLAVGEADIEGVTGDVMIDTWSANAEARNIAGSWLFDSGSGDVDVRGAQGSLRIDTGSGNGTVNGMRGDLLDFDAGSGSVDATDVQVDRFRFDTGSGDVTARNLRARRGVADTGSGSVRLEYSGSAVDDLVIDTGSGSVDLTLPAGANARVTVDTGSGGVDVERSGALYERRSRDGAVLRFGDGQGRIRIDTGSGGVVIR